MAAKKSSVSLFLPERGRPMTYYTPAYQPCVQGCYGCSILTDIQLLHYLDIGGSSPAFSFLSKV